MIVNQTRFEAKCLKQTAVKAPNGGLTRQQQGAKNQTAKSGIEAL